MNESVYAVAGAVVLYNPADNVLDELSSYIDQISRLYVIDNSIQHNDMLVERFREIPKIVYINNGGNKGIATALNVAAQKAMHDDFGYLLTMDQDTRLSANHVTTLMEGFIQDSTGKVAIMAPRYTKRSENQNQRYETVLMTMTSGNVLNLASYKAAGPFMDELFIDHVDHEYCLRLNRSGMKVIQDNEVEISHRPGTISEIDLLGAKFSFSSHSPRRLYYFCRNGFYVAKLYRKAFPSFTFTFLKLIMKEGCKVPFERQKILRLQMMVKGYMDFRSRKFGALSGS